MLEEPRIFINDQEYGQWKTMNIRYALGSYSASMDFSAVDSPNLEVDSTNKPVLWTPDSEIRVTSALRPGVSSARAVSNESNTQIFRGRLDSWTNGISATSTSTNLSARSLSAILDDSYPLRNNINFGNISLNSYVRRVLGFYDIEADFQIEPGQRIPESVRYDKFDLFLTIKNNLDAALNSIDDRGVIPLALFDGRVRFFVETNRVGERASNTFNQDGYGEVFDNDNNIIRNIKNITFAVDEKRMYRTYEAVGQSTLNFNTSPTDAANSPHQRDTDPRISFDKRLLRKKIRGDFTSSQLRGQATYMKNIAFGRSRKIDLSVSGWRYESGKFIQPGQIVSLDSRIAERAGVVSDDWLVDSVEYSYVNSSNINLTGGSSDGTTCQISLVKRETYSRSPNLDNQPTNNGLLGQN